MLADKYIHYTNRNVKTNTKSTLALIGVCIILFMVIADITAVKVALANI